MSLSDSFRFHLREATPVQARQEAHWRQRPGCLAKQEPNEKHAFESQRMQTDLQASYESYHSLVFSLTTRSLSNVRLVAPEVTGLQTLPESLTLFTQLHLPQGLSKSFEESSP